MKEQLADMRPEFQACREQRHRWTDHDVLQEAFALRVVEVCEVCSAERTSILSLRKATRGHIVRRWMSHYPEGYLMPKGVGRLDVDDLGELRLIRRGF